jgi:hypothetical protein
VLLLPANQGSLDRTIATLARCPLPP